MMYFGAKLKRNTFLDFIEHLFWRKNIISDLGLIPACILNFAWHPDMVEEIKQQLGPNAIYLKDEIAALAKSDWNVIDFNRI